MPLIIMALVTALMSALRELLPGLVGRLLLAIGIGFAAHKLAMPTLLGFVQSHVNGMPALLVGYFGALGLDVVTTIWLSTIIAARAQKAFLTKVGT